LGDWRFHTPGWVDSDLPQHILAAWHDHHVELAEEFLDDMRNALPPGSDPSVIPYVNPAAVEVPAQRTPTPVQWDGFPEAVDTRFRGSAKYPQSDHLGHEDWFGFGVRDLPIVDVNTGAEFDIDCRVRDRQDEYLEWHAREVDGVLRSITFVCEGYDYYQFLFRQGEDGRERVAKRYRDCTGDDAITPEDLAAPATLGFRLPDGRVEPFVAAGDLNPRNRFNRENGIVHLSHRANSLAAEVRLAVTSALPRVDGNDKLVHGGDPKRLMCCTLAGDPARSSDPNIAAGAYLAVTDPEAPQRFTLTDPIGLYIADFAFGSLQHPNGESASRDYWTVTRGKDADPIDDRKKSRILRLHLEIPEGDGVLGEMLIDGVPIEHPAQLAELVTMHLLVDTWNAPKGSKVTAIDCIGGCCRDNDTSLLDSYLAKNGAPCGPGSVDAYPDLVRQTGAAAPPPAPLVAVAPTSSRRRP
jgi:hypothetical protein